MIIPCIDVMGGKVVQLVRGEEKALELEFADQAVGMFEGFPLLHIIDLDAAMGSGDNRHLIQELLQKVKARVGGGIRSLESAKAITALGASQLIIGTNAFSPEGINRPFLNDLTVAIGPERIIVAIDVKDGRIATRGWKDTLELTPADVLEDLEPYCDGLLCTYVDREGMLQGTNLPFFHDLRARTKKTLIAAGGITTIEEVRELVADKIEVALGMAVYTGKLSLDDLRTLNASTGPG